MNNDADGDLGILATQWMDGKSSVHNLLAENAKKDGDTNRRLKVVLQFWVMTLLTSEITILTTLIFFQALQIDKFQLNDYIFGIFLNGCLAQTFFLAKPIVSHLFPGKLPIH